MGHRRPSRGIYTPSHPNVYASNSMPTHTDQTKGPNRYASPIKVQPPTVQPWSGWSIRTGVVVQAPRPWPLGMFGRCGPDLLSITGQTLSRTHSVLERARGCRDDRDRWNYKPRSRPQGAARAGGRIHKTRENPARGGRATRWPGGSTPDEPRPASGLTGTKEPRAATHGTRPSLSIVACKEGGANPTIPMPQPGSELTRQ